MQLDERILIIRDKVLQFYKIYEKVWIGMAKFLSMLLVMVAISRAIGYAPTLTRSYIIAALALVSTMLPAQYIMLEILGVIVIHLLHFNWIIGGVALVIFISLYILFIRLYPKESLLIILTMLAMKVELLCMLPIVAGLFGGLGAILAILIGIVGHFSFTSLEMMLQSLLKTEDLVVWIQENLNLYITQIFYNKELLAMLSICLIVFCVVYIIRKQVIDYAPYLAVVIGGVMNILGFILAELFLDISMNIFLLVFMTIISVVIALGIQFVSRPADYSRSESIRFEDEDNYYMVKVIPKMQVRKSVTKVQKVYIPPNRTEEINMEE
ncbi:MAG: hypothetical protein E6590_05175 [Clostridiales bacterium]|jgi:hypothetical protein|uniref:hypothetical protein n=1 Tax=Zhenhengia sp. TaxID=2944208 RepID=UPI001B78FEE7|nr:hypothetical protein [Niameybacter sp.]MDU6359343.1 hypothetical protein [Clostridiales bacterium]